MEYVIRQANESETEYLPAIEQAASELFADTEFAEETRQACLSIEFLNEQQRIGRLWVAEARGLPVGFAVATQIGENAHLHELSVHPDHQRKGIGRRLTEAVCSWASTAGFRSISLSTYLDVPWNAPFYRSLGFRTLDLLGPTYESLRMEESEGGLDVSKRVVMVRDL